MKYMYGLVGLGFMWFLFCLFFLTGCTYSINMVHSEGTAEDVVDEAQTAHPNIVPNINIPIPGI